MQENLLFDHKLQEKASVKDGGDAFKRYKFQKKWLSKVKLGALIIYYFVVPFFQTPQWCLNYFQDDGLKLILNCHEVDGGSIKYSNLPQLAPWLTNVTDFLCLFSITFYFWFKITWREISQRSKVRLGILTAIFAFSTIDLATSTIREKYPYFSNFMRPIVIMIMMSQVRATTKSVILNVKDSLTVITMIFLYITFFSVVGVFLFKDTYEGFSLLTGVSNAYY